MNNKQQDWRSKVIEMINECANDYEILGVIESQITKAEKRGYNEGYQDGRQYESEVTDKAIDLTRKEERLKAVNRMIIRTDNELEAWKKEKQQLEQLLSE